MRLVITTWLMSFSLATNGTVLFMGPGTSNIEYHAMIKADPGLETPTNYYLRTHPNSDQTTQILELFAEAQQSFLGSNPSDAIAKYKRLVEQSSSADWPKRERQIFFIAFLRLAQLTTGEQEQDDWLKASLNMGDDLAIDSRLIPPPLISRWQKLKAGSYAQEISIKFDEEDTLLVNGKPCVKVGCRNLQLSEVPVRLTLLSNQRQPLTKIMRPKELVNETFRADPWLQGQCSDYKYLSSTEEYNDRAAFWGARCSEKSLHLGITKPNAPTLPVAEIKSSTPIYKSKWFWLGTSALAVVAIVYMNQNKKKDRESSTTYGY